ncbi:hypothetical protein MMC08_002173 [Hypocenomyce scalaris]|nr:hypothetical protein [Hypocenomyce scalaris]
MCYEGSVAHSLQTAVADSCTNAVHPTPSVEKLAPDTANDGRSPRREVWRDDDAFHPSLPPPRRDRRLTARPASSNTSAPENDPSRLQGPGKASMESSDPGTADLRAWAREQEMTRPGENGSLPTQGLGMLFGGFGRFGLPRQGDTKAPPVSPAYEDVGGEGPDGGRGEGDGRVALAVGDAGSDERHHGRISKLFHKGVRTRRREMEMEERGMRLLDRSPRN